MRAEMNFKFQFLFGAIGRAAELPFPVESSSFNSYLVRLEARSTTYAGYGSKVSIPIWCDWKFLAMLVNSNLPNVSIPIWCDWKVARLLLC